MLEVERWPVEREGSDGASPIDENRLIAHISSCGSAKEDHYTPRAHACTNAMT